MNIDHTLQSTETRHSYSFHRRKLVKMWGGAGRVECRGEGIPSLLSSIGCGLWLQKKI